MNNLYIMFQSDSDLLYFTEVPPGKDRLTAEDGWFVSLRAGPWGVDVWTETLLDRERGLDMDQAEECVLRFLKARGWDIP